FEHDVGRDGVVAPADVTEQGVRIGQRVPGDRFLRAHLAHALATASAAAGRHLEGALPVHEVFRLGAGRVAVEGVAVRQAHRALGGAGGGALALAGRGGQGVNAVGLHGQAEAAARRGDVRGVHEVVGRVGGVDVGRPDVDGS